MPDPDQKPGNDGQNFSRAFSRMGLWLSGAAFIGSAALVLWNRRALKSLREAADKPVPPQPPRDDGGIY